MKMKYFGTDGFRGRANDNLRVEHALKIGQFLGWYYGARIGEKSTLCHRKGYQTLKLHV